MAGSVASVERTLIAVRLLRKSTIGFGADMTKTPEEMATEFLLKSDCAHSAFLAGYQAAKDEELAKDQKIAALWTESIKNMLPSVHEITLFPSELTKAKDAEVIAKMDAAIKKAQEQK